MIDSQELRILRCQEHGNSQCAQSWMCPFGRSWQFIGDPDNDCSGLLKKLLHEILIPDVVSTVPEKYVPRVQCCYLMPQHSCADPLSQGIGMVMWKYDPIHKTRDLNESMFFDAEKRTFTR